MGPPKNNTKNTSKYTALDLAKDYYLIQRNDGTSEECWNRQRLARKILAKDFKNDFDPARSEKMNQTIEVIFDFLESRGVRRSSILRILNQTKQELIRYLKREIKTDSDKKLGYSKKNKPRVSLSTAASKLPLFTKAMYSLHDLIRPKYLESKDRKKTFDEPVFVRKTPTSIVWGLMCWKFPKVFPKQNKEQIRKRIYSYHNKII